ncbi:hypothetical protein SAE01_33180 [Segetibacter aerophilus]|uniref:DUF5916 domain-containing protein n=1 Tax=Segetibacter aerophilus TaxID=670293 RepID=A0A512BFT5_9BACT|nr:hypothetical protein SAE01_33180 [Segetibacter aerophilus]
MGSIKIDGVLDELAWKEVKSATNFIEQRPNAGKREDSSSRTTMYLLYDNTSVYFAGYCYEKTKDSISKELIGRDKVGINDFAGVILDTYNDKINALGFFVTPYGEQFDIKYSTNNEDISWSAVWESRVKINSDGWSFEVRIPYSALRFVSKETQSWGLNFVRRRNKTGQQFTWNSIDPKVNGFINQEGQWRDIGKIEAPIRLSLSPYFSSYINHYKLDSKPWNTSINGGMDVKYGITESFTLDMTLVPDFGQVRSDNQVLNLSPFEVKYNENRPFFTEGTELFSKGDLFYSRRIGGVPLHFGDAYNNLGAGEKVTRNAQEAKLVNATKISGRTSKGLGIGFFNAITNPTYAKIENSLGQTREIETNPLTNYNILVLDQTLKNNSSVSFINTNVLRNGSDYDANVSAALFNFNNKKNTYNWTGKFAVSHLTNPSSNGITGYSHNLGFGKTGGRWNYQLIQEIADKKYDINDMGILNTRNYVDHYLWTGYRWIEPKNWYKRVQINFNAYQSSLFQPFANQKIGSNFQSFRTNVNANSQLKNLWWVGLFVGYVAEGNDFYEPRETGYSFKSPQRVQFAGWFETNEAKKYYASVNYFVGIRKLFNSPNHELTLLHRYRFSDKFSLTQSLLYNPATNDAGFSQKLFETNASGTNVLKSIIFSRRDVKTIENVVEAKYNFNNKSGVTFRARHYWSKVEQRQLYDLNTDGSLSPARETNIALRPQNFNIFNIDAIYTLQFAPGSFINIVWKDQGILSNQAIDYSYFKNFDRTISEPHNNNLSIKVIYYLDYLNLKKLKKSKS